jgi:hypothetical protein
MTNPEVVWGEHIEWGGERWIPAPDNEIEPLAIMYGSLLRRADYVAFGMQKEENYLQEVIAKMQRRSGGERGNNFEVWRQLRLKMRRQVLEEALPRRFDEKYERLVLFARSLDAGPDQLTIEYPEAS